MNRKKEDENELDSHDAIVLEAQDLILPIALRLGFLDLLDVQLAQHCLFAELEYELSNKDYVDIAVFWFDAPLFYIEVKSKREAQTASAWARQVKRYAKVTGNPVLLAVGHDLGAVQSRYLKAANTPLVDIRTFK